MISPPDNRRDSRFRTYDRVESAVFLRTTEEFGGLSNMAGGFPLQVNAVRILTSEALYQACRFPHMPEVQRLIIAQASPMTAKMKSKPYRRESRPDWNQVRVKIMRWCLRVKLAQNWTRFSELLLATGTRPIVEASRKDDFWGANPVDDRTLVGINVLGRLLMELREEVRSGALVDPMHVDPLSIPEFLLDGHPIQPIIGRGESDYRKSGQRPERRVIASPPRVIAKQISMVYPAQSSANPESQAVGKTSLKPYPGYKDSGVPWLGNIPAHWEVRRNGRLFVQRNETAFPDLPILEVSLKTGVRVRDFDTSSRKQVMSDRGKYKCARQGDITYNMMRMWQGAVGIAPVHGLVSPAYVVARPLAGSTVRYFEFLFRTVEYMREVNDYSRGIVSDRNRLYWTDFKQIASPYPPPAEQAAIVRFLYHADRRIQRYIRAKKKLIALLNEQKQAIIHRAVTRGLNPNVRLKPSGVEWLGEVPENWEVVRLGRLIDMTVGFPFKSEGFSLCEADVRLLRGINIAPGRVRWETTVRWPATDTDRFATYQLQEGDLVLGMDRPLVRGGVRVARITANDLPSLLLQRVALIRPHADLDSDFVLRIIAGKSFTDYLAPIFTGISVPHISPDQIDAFRIALPDRTVQLEIGRQLKGATATLNSSIEAADREIELLHEYRTRLIADVVTGKLDVRDAAAELADEAGEWEPMEEGEEPSEEGGETEEDDDAEEGALA